MSELTIAPQPIDSYIPPDYYMDSPLNPPEATGGTGGDGISSFLNDINSAFTSAGNLVQTVFDPNNTGSLFNITVKPDQQTQSQILGLPTGLKIGGLLIGALILILLFRR